MTYSYARRSPVGTAGWTHASAGAPKAGTIPVRLYARLLFFAGRRRELLFRLQRRREVGVSKVVVGALRFGKEDKRKPNTVIQGAMQAAWPFFFRGPGWAVLFAIIYWRPGRRPYMQSPFCDPAHATALAKPAARHNVDNANHTDAKCPQMAPSHQQN